MVKQIDPMVKPQVAKMVIYQGDRLLLQLRDHKPDIFYPNHWGLFGGTVDHGETPAGGDEARTRGGIRLDTIGV